MSSTDTNLARRVQSPCINICTLDDDDVCVGCYRNIVEICAWASASEAERLQIVESAEMRQAGSVRRD